MRRVWQMIFPKRQFKMSMDASVNFLEDAERRPHCCVHYELQAKTEESPSQGTRTWRICLNHNNSINYLREPYLRHNNWLCGLPARICDCIAICLSHVLSPRDNVIRPMTFILLVFITVIRRKRSSGLLNDIGILNDRLESSIEKSFKR